jgi:murein DD-endopeptidase MepM/ murein hydrolase activator NlpD
MQKQENRKFLLNILTIILLIFILAALFLTFISSRLEEIRNEKIALLEQNKILQKKIEKKKHFYEEIEDKIADIKVLIDKDRYHDNQDVKRLLKTITTKQKELIIQAIPSGYPSKARRITSSFGYRIHPISHDRKFHHGLDFGGKLGTPIVATADGIVEFAGFNKGGYGNLVVLSHNFGFKTAYGHMLDNLKVKSGAFVKKGEVIGYLGNSGISTGPHLHYEVKFIKRVLDPKNFIVLTDKSFDTIAMRENRVNWSALASAIFHQLSFQSF